LDSFMSCLRRWARAGCAVGLTDAQLLERFVREREGAAFEALLRSHGPMVFGVCRRLLHNAQDVEDAFQATFLVLVRKAQSISKRESVGSWLYGVAYRIASRERIRQTNRNKHEREFVQAMRDKGSPSDVKQTWSVVNEELNRLPEKYRAPLVLHYLEGKTKDETALQLGWPEGTVSGRLARGREMLRDRLIKRGMEASSVAMIAGFVGQGVLDAVPQTLVRTVLQSTVCAAGKVVTAGISTKVLALAKGAQRAMFISKLKLIAVLVAAGLVVGGTAWTVASLPAGQANEKPPPAAKQEPKRAQKPPKTDLERMQGDWKVVFKKDTGREAPKEAIESWDHLFFIQGDSLVIRDKAKILQGTVKVNSAANPKTINVTIGKGGEKREGIYTFEGEKLKVCWAGWERQRPTKFSAEKEDRGDWIMILEKDTSVRNELEEQARKDKAKEARLRIAGILYELGRAMHGYHDEHGHFPHAAISDKEGKPLLSWRVALLPSLGYEELYKEFKLDEPWDGPHNKPCWRRCPKCSPLRKEVRKKARPRITRCSWGRIRFLKREKTLGTKTLPTERWIRS
jgi:RNA polymerase sigma factor (sigma-70 family)